MEKVVLLGAGITNLTLANILLSKGYDVTLIEKTPKIGGMCASFRYGRYTLDYGPHKFYTQLPGIEEDFKKIIGKENYLEIPKKNSIRLLGKYFDFPVKISQLLLGIPIAKAIRIGLDLMKAKISSRKVISYKDYFIKGFGETGYATVFEGFAKKVWGNPEELSEELARKRSPAGSIFDVLKSALIKNDKNLSAEYFLYPKKGFGEICNSLEKSILNKKGKIIVNANIEKINIKSGQPDNIEFSISGKKKSIKCDIVVSSIPINELANLVFPAFSEEILDSAKKLKFRSLIVAYLFIDRPKVLKENWIFFPEEEFCFNRVAELKSFSPDIYPKDKTVLSAELTCNVNDPIFSESDDKIKEKVVKDLVKAGLIKENEVFDFITKRAKKAYPVYDLDYKNNLNRVLNQIDNIKDFYMVGRPGLFNYNNSDHSMDMANKTAEVIINKESKAKWIKLREYFDSYRIVD